MVLFASAATSQSRVGAPVSVVYGGDATFAPYEYLDAQGTPHGFNVELIRALGGEAGVAVDIRLQEWWSVLRDLSEGSLVSFPHRERAPRYDLCADVDLPQDIMFPDAPGPRAARRAPRRPRCRAPGS